jgi:hypothetical protein
MERVDGMAGRLNIISNVITSSNNPPGSIVEADILVESLILAQDQRWRRA